MAGKAFDVNSPFWQGVSRLGDIIVLNLLTVLCSLPLVTVGAALTALYDCCWKLQEEKGGGVLRLYWNSFRANFLKSTGLWLIVALLGLAISSVLWLARGPVSTVVVSVLLFILFFLTSYVWVLQGRFENPIVRTLLNSMLISVARLPYTVGIVAIWVVVVALFAVTTWQLPGALPPLILLGVGLPAYGSIPLFQRALQPWLPQVNEEDTAEA